MQPTAPESSPPTNYYTAAYDRSSFKAEVRSPNLRHHKNVDGRPLELVHSSGDPGDLEVHLMYQPRAVYQEADMSHAACWFGAERSHRHKHPKFWF